MQISVILKVFLEWLAPYTSVSLTRFPGTSQVQRSSVPSGLEHFVRSIWRILLHLSHTWGVRSTFFSGFGFPHLENTFRVLGGGSGHPCAPAGQPLEAEHGCWEAADVRSPDHSLSGRPRRPLHRNWQYLENAGHFLSARPVSPVNKTKRV